MTATPLTGTAPPPRRRPGRPRLFETATELRVHFPTDLWRQLRHEAETRQLSVSALVRAALTDWMTRAGESVAEPETQPSST